MNRLANLLPTAWAQAMVRSREVLHGLLTLSSEQRLVFVIREITYHSARLMPISARNSSRFRYGIKELPIVLTDPLNSLETSCFLSAERMERRFKSVQELPTWKCT